MLESSASVFFTKTVSKESCDKFHEEEMLHNVRHTTPQNDSFSQGGVSPTKTNQTPTMSFYQV